jgi:hypothetical protein
MRDASQNAVTLVGLATFRQSDQRRNPLSTHNTSGISTPSSEVTSGNVGPLGTPRANTWGYVADPACSLEAWPVKKKTRASGEQASLGSADSLTREPHNKVKEHTK